MCTAPGLYRITQYLLLSAQPEPDQALESGLFTKDSMKEFGGKICKKCDLFPNCERWTRGWGHNNEALTLA